MATNAGSRAEKDDGTRAQGAIDRITVALIRRAAEDLQALQDRTGYSKTDIVNRAITMYEFIDAQQKAGKDLLVRDPKTEKTELVRFL